MRVTFVTLFPELCQQAMHTGVLGRGIDKGVLQVDTVNIRDFSNNKHGTVDDTPYGGGPGMVLRVEPVVHAVESVALQGNARRILLTPNGKTFKQDKARELSTLDHLVFICGRYEGIDERVRLCLNPEELSLGDFVLTGGELAALAMADATCRLIEGVLGDHESTTEESFSTPQAGLEYPHYTRPREFMGHQVPDILIGGHHQEIRNWRQKKAEELTRERRPDLMGCSKIAI